MEDIYQEEKDQKYPLVPATPVGNAMPGEEEGEFPDWVWTFMEATANGMSTKDICRHLPNMPKFSVVQYWLMTNEKFIEMYQKALHVLLVTDISELRSILDGQDGSNTGRDRLRFEGRLKLLDRLNAAIGGQVAKNPIQSFIEDMQNRNAREGFKIGLDINEHKHS